MGATAVKDSWMTLDEAAAYLRVTRSTLYRWIKAGELRCYKLGRRSVRVKRDELDRLLRPIPIPRDGKVDDSTRLSEAAFAEDWDSDEDAIYDNWEVIYGVRKR